MEQQFGAGTTVYDAAGEKIGTIRGYDGTGDYLDVEKGWLFPKDIYIPLSAVQRRDADGVYLSLYKDDLSDQQYETPPVQTAGATGATAAYYTDTTTAGYTDTTDTGNAANAATTGTTDQDIRVPVLEEDLVVGKRQDEVGRVHLHKDVVTEQQSVPVQVQREQVTVERVPVDQAIDPAVARDAFQSEDIAVPVMGEQVVAGKRVRETEEVRLHKDTIAAQQQVSDTVRKERVTIDPPPPGQDVDTLPNPTTIDPAGQG